MEQLDLSFFLDEFSWVSVLDILLVTLAIAVALVQVRGTRAVQVLRGLIIFALFLILIDSFVAQLTAVRWLTSNALPALFVAIPVIFQDELRRVFAQLGHAGGVMRYFRRTKDEDAMIEGIVDACRRLSTRRYGALIVIERDTGLQEFINTGIILDAKVTAPLLLAIFHKDADLHDGGVIIRNGRVASASAVMPLSNTRITDRQMGLRHRAALGTSEVSDAVIVIVSEETGHIAIAHNGRVLPRQPQQQLGTILRAFLRNGQVRAE